MRFVILGPVMAYGEDGPLPLGPPKRRLLLALLLSSGERAVPLEAAVEAVWGGNAPASAVQNVYQHISHLRQVLGHDAIAGQGRSGYTVAGLPANLDAHTFEDLAERGSRALAGGDAPTATRTLRQALAMWRGPAFGDLAGEPALHQEAERLEELRLAALENRIEADLTAGLHEPAIAELLVLTRSHPYRERFVAQLMHGLRVTQRASEALEVYRRTRALFVEELGIEPGPVLRRLHQAILAGEPYSTGPSSGSARPSSVISATPDVEPAAVAVPHELPAGVRFVGRRAQLRELDALLPRTTDRTPPPVIVTAVVGTAGVGKTALAVHWAHQVAHRFPDGRLYLNMHGYSAESPRRPHCAVSALLRSLGMPAEQIPVDLAEAAARYRSLIAGRRMLIVLDNARSAAQIRPLLPGEGGSFVLVTSRDRLTGLVAQDGAHRLTLDVMTEKESVALLARTLGSSRVNHEPQAAAALAARCANLPLSLCIAAALLNDHPKQGITHFVGQLASGDPLVGLTVDGQEDGEIAVRAAFDLSYQALDPSLRSVFRGLGLVGCPDFTAEAVAAQTGMGRVAADRALRRLAAAHLVEESRPGRYTLHDLLREYAGQLARTTDDEESLAAARRRLCDWYLTTVTTAQRLLHAGQRQSPPDVAAPSNGHAPPTLTDYASALAWLDAERHNLVEVVTCASRHGLDRTCVHLADRLRGYFDLRRHITDWETVAGLAREAAARSDDEALHPIALHGAAHLGFVLARYAQAIACVKELLALMPADASAKSRADLMSNLGYLLARVGRTAEAESLLGQARDLARTAGSTASQAGILLNLANLHRDCGDLAEGRTAALTSLRLSRNSDEPRWVAMSLGTLGELAHLQGRYAEALTYHDDSLEMHRRQGDRHGETATLAWLAHTCLDLGRWEESHHHASTARDQAREIGDRHQLVHSMIVLAAHSLATGDPEAALATCRTALGLAVELGDPYLECDAALGAGSASAADGGSDAEHLAQRALTIARRCRFRVLEGRALTMLATLAHERADHDQAVEQAFQALAIHRSTGHRLGEAHTHTLLGRALRAAGDPRAEEHGQAADQTLTDLGLTGRLT
ncbi:BTAD domain-containing putative transcriptional regulator [Nonomuraea sp. NPDC050663]|uniref:AfsR/SARP family transcriptional regulator n=1 Tax=Nonomuraea sp. NPDC050663 TaxID=3364370 RepID=UPI00378F4CBF